MKQVDDRWAYLWFSKIPTQKSKIRIWIDEPSNKTISRFYCTVSFGWDFCLVSNAEWHIVKFILLLLIILVLIIAVNSAEDVNSHENVDKFRFSTEFMKVNAGIVNLLLRMCKCIHIKYAWQAKNTKVGKNSKTNTKSECKIGKQESH